MKRTSIWVSLVSSVALLASGVLAQGVPAPFTNRLQTFTPTGVVARPILLRSAKDGTKRIFIVQQAGLIRFFRPGATTPTDFINLSSKIVIPGSTGDERGLLGLTFHPQFATNGRFFVNYTRVGDGVTVVSEIRTFDGTGNTTGDISTERIVFTVPQPFSNHNGGMIEFGPDGFLYIGMGDGGSANDPGNRAQNRSLLLGKLLRIDVNIPQGSTVPYLIPPTNPFTGAGTARCDGGSTTGGATCQEIWALGMRNPWRWSFDRGANNELWVADVGQGAIEEVNRIATGGGNYGWRVFEGSNCTNLDPTLCATPSNYVMPLFNYNHSGGRCSITGGYVYRGMLGNLPHGSYNYGDYCTGEVFLYNGVTSQVLFDTPRTVTSFGEDEDAENYVMYGNGQIDKIVRARASADFDGDFKTDTAVYRPSTGTWYAYNSSNGTVKIQQFGLNGDIPVSEDYDGDNISDIAVFRPSTNVWYSFNSGSNTVSITGFGSAGDIPAQGDFDGDSKADIAIFRPSTGAWWIRRSTNPGSLVMTPFGLSGDIPVANDYDGDGKVDIAVFRPSDGNWYRLSSANGAVSIVRFGLSGDIPSPGDFDGDGRADTIVYRPSTGVWYSLASQNGAFSATAFGLSNDVPVVGDYDGDGRDDIAVFRPSIGVWYSIRSSNSAVTTFHFGSPGDLPAPNTDRP